MILSYHAGRYGRLDTLNSKTRPLFQILYTEAGGGEKHFYGIGLYCLFTQKETLTFIYVMPGK